MTRKLYVPSPIIREVMSTSYQVFALTAPNEARMAASAGGAVFQVTVASLHVLSATLWKSPPLSEELTLYRRSLALAID